jgi:acyl carrier protein
MSDRPVVSEVIVKAWCEILSVSRADITDDANFFELGGNSVGAARLMTLVEQQLPLRFPLHVLFLDGSLSSVVAECERLVAAQ